MRDKWFWEGSWPGQAGYECLEAPGELPSWSAWARLGEEEASGFSSGSSAWGLARMFYVDVVEPGLTA